jgi:hypothetical protein
MRHLSSYTEFPIKQDDEEIPAERCKNCNERGESGKLEIGKKEDRKKKTDIRCDRPKTMHMHILKKTMQ